MIFGGNAGCFGYIFKMHVALVEIELIAYFITGEKNILQSVVIEIADGHTSAIIHIFEVQDIDGIIFCNGVGKMNSCCVPIQFFEFFLRAGIEKKKSSNEDGGP